ncbi:hypothetical protein P9B03_08700 [Metasolibacillus meyeri]|uniref:Uncharacterized protein n=1 Tax=Metasolibacillus meyeri TaxID=1071052 RepID=A0AAW9NRK1_9BACL|nr:hypothetical protein [Metasolibacillus meyeri]MEC1178558.1 hypothetical protein [Metasolibacillus meyeri]
MKKLLLTFSTYVAGLGLFITLTNSAAAFHEDSSKTIEHQKMDVYIESTELQETNNITPFWNDPGAGGGIGINYIYLDKHIKTQGYLTNSQLRDYVKQVKNRATGVSIMSETVSWLSLNPGIAMSIGGIGLGSLFANFDQVSEHASQGYGMGWVHMYADGPNTLSIIPRRDFSKSLILYKTR